MIYRDRPEGSIGRREDTTTIDTRDDYSCLSFLPEASSREGLDALSCASVFTGDKGRFITPDDIGRGYAEPEETSRGFGRMRPLPATSPYPPRRDLEHAPQDHADVERYASDAARVMPELDAVSMATPPADAPLVLTWAVPASSPSGFTMLSIEINTEGGYGGPFDPTSFPTPTAPSGEWDSWSSGYGYPYRGQSSVIFDVVVDMPAEDEAGAPNRMSVTRPMRMGSLDASLVLRPIDGTIVDDPERSPGSGADRLRFMDDGARVRVEARVLCRP